MNFDKSKLYRIEKIQSFNPNSDMPEGYWAIGNLENPPVAEKKLEMLRYYNSNNPVGQGRLGYFYTSTIEECIELDDCWELHTKNSIYKLEEYENYK